MDPKRTNLYRTRIERVKAFIDAGLYDDPWILKHVWDEETWEAIGERPPLSSLIQDVLDCPTGAGDRFRNLTADALSRTLCDVVDEPFIRKEFPCHGGRGDIELPLRPENLGQNLLWQTWNNRYGIASIVVETKNTKQAASIRDVHQILGYIVTARVGRFGFLVSRNGFSRNAIKTLRVIAETGDFLILPLDQADVCEFATIDSFDKQAASTFIRRKETQLRQAA